MEVFPTTPKMVITLDDEDTQDWVEINMDTNDEFIEDIPVDEETLRLNDLHEEAKGTIIEPMKIPKAYQLCKHLNHCMNGNSYEYSTLQEILCNHIGPNSLVVFVPFYVKTVSLRNITWMAAPFLVNKNLLGEIIHLNPASWIIQDYSILLENYINSVSEEEGTEINLSIDTEQVIEFGQKLGNEKIQDWLCNINEHLEHSILINLVMNNTFYLLAFSYLDSSSTLSDIHVTNDDKIQKGICGLTLLYCTHNEMGEIQVINIASIKLSTNYKNVAYGDFVSLLLEDLNAPIFIYASQKSYMESVFVSNIYSWSFWLLKQAHRIYNINPYICLVSNMDIKMLCPDSETHSESCSTCNCINLLCNLCTTNGATLRKNGEKPPSLVMSKETAQQAWNSLTIPNIHICNHQKYIVYGSTFNHMNYNICNAC